MTWSDKEAMAAEFALGTLDGIERERVVAALESDPELQKLIEDWDRRLAGLSAPPSPATPPPDLLSRIERSIDDSTLPGTNTLRAGAGRWRLVAKGVEKKSLRIDEVARRQSFLIRMAPGAHYDPHDHDGDEECVVLEGVLRFGDLELGAGDYHLAPAGTSHPAAFSQTGCVMFVSTAL